MVAFCIGHPRYRDPRSFSPFGDPLHLSQSQVSPDKLMPVVEKDQRLLFQEYILDPSRVVKEVVLDHGITIVDFVRFQCGEEIKVDANPES